MILTINSIYRMLLVFLIIWQGLLVGMKTANALEISLSQGISWTFQMLSGEPIEQTLSLSISKIENIQSATAVVVIGPLWDVQSIDMVNKNFEGTFKVENNRLNIRLNRVVQAENTQVRLVDIDILPVLSKINNIDKGFGEFVFEDATLTAIDGHRITDFELSPGSWFVVTDQESCILTTVLFNEIPLANVSVQLVGLSGGQGIRGSPKNTNSKGEVCVDYPPDPGFLSPGDSIQGKFLIKPTSNSSKMFDPVVKNLQLEVIEPCCGFNEVTINLNPESSIQRWDKLR